MGELYHCFYKEPQGEAILASCFRNVNGKEANYVFAATHLTKALAFAFSYHDQEIVMNGNIDNSPDEFALLCGGQKTIDKKRHIKVMAFPDDGFEEIPGARQAVSENPVPFSRARVVMETSTIDDLMKQGLQIFVLPHDIDHYLDPDGKFSSGEQYFLTAKNSAEALKNIMSDLGARWINWEKGIEPHSEILSEISHQPDTGPAQQFKRAPS